MARILGIRILGAAVETACAALTAVKKIHYGQWQIPAPDNIQDELSAVVVQYKSSIKGIREGGSIQYDHTFLLTYLRYLDTATELAGELVQAEAELCFNLFIQGRFPLPGYTGDNQIASGIQVKFAFSTGFEQKDGFLLDSAPIEVVEIPLVIQATHFDPANPNP